MIPLTYFILLPRPSRFTDTSLPPEALPDSVVGAEYTALPTSDDDEQAAGEEVVGLGDATKLRNIALSMEDKWRLVRPLVGRYMMPLCTLL